MKKTIQFDLFGEQQTIYFDILRLADFERLSGIPMNQLASQRDAGVNFCLAGLQIGMQHHNRKATRVDYAEKIEQYIEDGGKLDDIAIKIVNAILVTGIYGSAKEEEDEKNVDRTAK